MSGCPTTGWCRVSFLMLKHPLPARRDSLGVSNAPSASVLAAAAESALGDRYTTTASAERVGSVNEWVPHHRVVSGQLLDGKSSTHRSPKRA